MDCEVSKIDYQSIPHKKTFVWKKEYGCAAIVSANGNRVLLNPEATTVWEQIDEVNSIVDIISILKSKYNYEQEQAEKLVISTINSIKELDLISYDNYLWRDDDEE